MSIKLPRNVEKQLQFIARDFASRGERISGRVVTADDLAVAAASIFIRSYIANNPAKAPELAAAIGADAREVDELRVGALIAESNTMARQ